MVTAREADEEAGQAKARRKEKQRRQSLAIRPKETANEAAAAADSADAAVAVVIIEDEDAAVEEAVLQSPNNLLLNYSGPRRMISKPLSIYVLEFTGRPRHEAVPDQLGHSHQEARRRRLVLLLVAMLHLVIVTIDQRRSGASRGAPLFAVSLAVRNC